MVCSPALHTMAIFGEAKIANAEEYDIGSNGSSAADRMHASALGGTAGIFTYRNLYVVALLIVQSEKFPPDFHHRVCGGPAVNMGKCSVVSSFLL